MEGTVERWRRRMEDGGICELSQEVLSLILSRLNAPDAIRASAVCKQWNGITQTLNHVRFLQSSPVTPYCMRIREDCQELELYGFKEYMRLSLDFLAERYNLLALLTCGGGLLLFLAALGVLVVCNPVTRQWHELPTLNPPVIFSYPRIYTFLRRPPTGSSSSLLLAHYLTCQEPWPYKQDVKEFQRPAISVIVPSSNQKHAEMVFLSGFKDERLETTSVAYDYRTRVYDWEAQSWTSGGRLPVKDFPSTDGVYLRGHIYTVTRMWQKSGVISYDLETGCWSNLPARVPACVMHPYLVQHNDALLLIGACNLMMDYGLLLRDILALIADPSSFGIWIWQLSECNTRWDEVARMREGIYRHLLRYSAAWFWFDCVGRGDVLYFADRTSGTPQLGYNFATDQWLAVPKMAGNNKSGISYSRQLFLYHPSAHAL